MATNAVKRATGAQFVFGDHAGDFAGGTAKTSLEIAATTDFQITMNSLADDDMAESAKVDLTATRAPGYQVHAAIESGASAMTTGERVDFYWAPSPEATLTDGNPGQMDGADTQVYSGVGTFDEMLLTTQFIGSLIVENTTNTVQIGIVNSFFVPASRYGILCVVNRSAGVFATDDVEHHVTFTEILPDIQAAA